MNKKPRAPKRGLIVGLSVAGGVVILGLSWLTVDRPGAVASWAQGLLVNVGSAVLLVAPIWFVSARLSRHVDEVRGEVGEVRDEVEGVRAETGAARDEVRAVREETAQSVEAVRRDVAGVREQVASMADYATRAAARIAEERAGDDAAYRALAEQEPSREGLMEAMRRATAGGVVSERDGVRAEMHPGAGDYVQIGYRPGSWDGDELTFDLVEIGGRQLSRVEWPEGTPVDEVTASLARQINAEGREGRLTGEEVAAWWRTISDTLVAGASHPSLRRIVELSPPQWAVTDDGVAPYRDRKWDGIARPTSEAGKRSVTAAKNWPWVNPDSLDHAAFVWGELFPQRDPWGDPDGIPF